MKEKNLREEIRNIVIARLRLTWEEEQECLDRITVDLLQLFQDWALEIVHEVKQVNESNGRYNACQEISERIKKTAELEEK